MMATRIVPRLFRRLFLPVVQTSQCHTGVKSLVDQQIMKNRVVMFSKSFCPFCKMAKDVLSEYIPHAINPEDYHVMEIEDLEHMDHIQDYLKDLTGAGSVPRVFVQGKFIGGGTDLADLHDDGKLEDILRE